MKFCRIIAKYVAVPEFPRYACRPARNQSASSQDDLVLLETFGRLVSIAIEQKNREKEIYYLAYSVSLTGLPNRRKPLTEFHKHDSPLSRDSVMHGCYWFV